MPPSVSPDQLARESQAAIARKDWGAADDLLRQLLTITPDDAAVLLNLGLTAYRQGALAEAERFLNKAALRGAGQESWLLLGHVYAAQRRGAEALRAFKAVLKADPSHHEALMALGDLRSRNGDRSGARENYRQASAANPQDVDAALKHAEHLWDEDPESAVAITLGTLANTGNLQVRARILQAVLWQVEFIERIRRGQMPYHAARLDELFFTYAADHLRDFESTYAALSSASADPAAKLGLGLARFCLGDRHGAEVLFNAAAPAIAGGILEAARFSPAFHSGLRAMSDDEITHGLPPVTIVRAPVQSAGGVLYLSCDPVYATNFGLPLLCSLREHSPETPVHLHLIDPSSEDTARLVAFCEQLAPLRFALTEERPGLASLPAQDARIYFHAVRFVRFHQALDLYDCPLWMTDVDAITQAPLSGLFARLEGNDIALRIRPGRLEPQNQFSACAIGAAPAAPARAYARQVASYIAHFHQRGHLRWGIDQLALYSVFADLADLGRAPGLGLLGNRDIVLDNHRGGGLWMTAGAQKFSALEREAQGAGVPQTAYARAFTAYRNQARTIAASIGWTL